MPAATISPMRLGQRRIRRRHFQRCLSSALARSPTKPTTNAVSSPTRPHGTRRDQPAQRHRSPGTTESRFSGGLWFLLRPDTAKVRLIITTH